MFTHKVLVNLRLEKKPKTTWLPSELLNFTTMLALITTCVCMCVFKLSVRVHSSVVRVLGLQSRDCKFDRQTGLCLLLMSQALFLIAPVLSAVERSWHHWCQAVSVFAFPLHNISGVEKGDWYARGTVGLPQTTFFRLVPQRGNLFRCNPRVIFDQKKSLPLHTYIKLFSEIDKKSIANMPWGMESARFQTKAFIREKLMQRM